MSAGASTEEIEHAAFLAMTTTGFPNMIAALSWVQEVFDEGEIVGLRLTTTDTYSYLW